MNEFNELEYVGFWPRVGASLIDTILLVAIMVPLGFMFFGRNYLADDVAVTVISGPANFIVSYVLPALAVLAFWTYRHATPGKMMFGARIVDARTGGAPSFGQHVIRYLGYFVSTIPFCLGLIWVAFDSRKQGWHDKMAGTVVVRSRRSAVESVRFDG